MYEISFEGIEKEGKKEIFKLNFMWEILWKITAIFFLKKNRQDVAIM